MIKITIFFYLFIWRAQPSGYGALKKTQNTKYKTIHNITLSKQNTKPHTKTLSKKEATKHNTKPQSNY